MTSSTTQNESDNALLDLNLCLENAVKNYLSPGVNICFDLPNPSTPPTQPTVSLFLYGVQEDLELRTGMVRTFDLEHGIMRPGSINIRCDYLITFWEATDSTGEGPQARPDSQAMTIMNQVLNALINNRELSGIPGSYTRVMIPQQLGNLSHFWQALGNKPRLCLNYSATVPMVLTEMNETYTPIADHRLDLTTDMENISENSSEYSISENKIGRQS